MPGWSALIAGFRSFVIDSFDLMQLGLQQFFLRLAAALFILLPGWYLSTKAGALVRRVTESSHRIDRTIVPMAATATIWGVRILVLIVVLAQLGIQTTSVIAVLGAAGLAVGLALQGTLQNIAAGIMLLILRPLRVGESVNVAGKAEGKVDEVGLFLTRFQQFDGTYITLPNNLVWGNPIINYSRNQARRIEFKTRLLYHHDLATALDRIQAVLTAHPLVLASPAPEAAVIDYGDFAAIVRVRAWVRAADFAAVQKSLQHDVALLVSQPFSASS